MRQLTSREKLESHLKTLHLLPAGSCSSVITETTNSTRVQAVPTRFVKCGCLLGRNCRLREAAMREADVIGD